MDSVLNPKTELELAGTEAVSVIKLTVNDREYSLRVKNNWTLLDLLRKKLNLTGAKEGCREGECGACTVIMNGRAVTSCLILAVEAEGASIETIEGQEIDGELSPEQQAFIECGAVQCGFCTPGMIMSAKALLERKDSPELEDIEDALAGNLCRCTGYYAIKRAVERAAALRREHRQ